MRVLGYEKCGFEENATLWVLGGQKTQHYDRKRLRGFGVYGKRNPTPGDAMEGLGCTEKASATRSELVADSTMNSPARSIQ